MTSTTDTAEHPEVSELSELAEGLLSPARTADVRRHLDGCVLCADVHASLEEIRSLLGTLPGPPQMPADVAGRIDAALAAEALLDASLPGIDTSPDESNATAPTREPDIADTAREASAARETDEHVSRETSPTVDRPAGHPRASTGPGRSAPRRRRRIAAAALGTLATVAAIGLGTLLIQSAGDNGSESGGTVASDQSDSRAFSKKELGDQVQSLLTESMSTSKADDPSHRSPGANSADGGVRTPEMETAPTLFGKEPDVPECVKRGISSEATPLATEKGTYEGTAAYLVVLPHATDTSRVSAYVVDASCVNGPASAKGEVLFTHTYPRR
ncbi:anti-sigma factor family protein [Streptomyces sp. NBC_01304]|uniref:anti-sigma factor family protein n=1 Tax=Streptomyces sp. NBC_01304 TaxID=2903818 RepID=UPI002E1640DD|nr:hypothetical protein OG430_25060 [Streptomyces sp. NBC_01304]